jgi:hypothetical protein
MAPTARSRTGRQATPICVSRGKARIVVTPLDRLEETESLRALRPAIQGRMPKAGIPDLFLEIMQRTGFAEAFTHLSERQARVEHFETSLWPP